MAIYDEGYSSFAGADFAYAKHENSTHIKIYHNEVKEFLYDETGKRWVTIHLSHDDPLLLMLFLKFKGRSEQ